MTSTTELRTVTKYNNLRNRMPRLVAQVGNIRVTDVLPEHIEKYLAKQDVAARFPVSLLRLAYYGDAFSLAPGSLK